MKKIFLFAVGFFIFANFASASFYLQILTAVREIPESAEKSTADFFGFSPDELQSLRAGKNVENLCGKVVDDFSIEKIFDCFSRVERVSEFETDLAEIEVFAREILTAGEIWQNGTREFPPETDYESGDEFAAGEMFDLNLSLELLSRLVFNEESGAFAEMNDFQNWRAEDFQNWQQNEAEKLQQKPDSFTKKPNWFARILQFIPAVFAKKNEVCRDKNSLNFPPEIPATAKTWPDSELPNLPGSFDAESSIDNSAENSERTSRENSSGKSTGNSEQNSKENSPGKSTENSKQNSKENSTTDSKENSEQNSKKNLTTDSPQKEEAECPSGSQKVFGIGKWNFCVPQFCNKIFCVEFEFVPGSFGIASGGDGREMDFSISNLFSATDKTLQTPYENLDKLSGEKNSNQSFFQNSRPTLAAENIFKIETKPMPSGDSDLNKKEPKNFREFFVEFQKESLPPGSLPISSEIENKVIPNDVIFSLLFTKDCHNFWRNAGMMKTKELFKKCEQEIRAKKPTAVAQIQDPRKVVATMQLKLTGKKEQIEIFETKLNETVELFKSFNRGVADILSEKYLKEIMQNRCEFPA